MPAGRGASNAEVIVPPRLFRVILPVSDVDRAAEFYAAVLGVAGRRVSPGRHYFRCGGVIVACLDARRDGDGYDAVPVPEWLYFATGDLEGLFERCRRAGASFETGEIHGQPAGGIVRRPWGERSFYARDPFGNGLCFVDERTVFSGE